MTDYMVKVVDLDTPNRNNRIYTTEAVQQALETVKLPMMGVLGEPEDHLTISLHRVSHAVEQLEIKDGAVWAKVNVLKTPGGLMLKQLLDAGHDVGYGIIGTGDVADDGTVSNLTIISISAVDGEARGLKNETNSN